jgi:hypothetical protein
MILLLAIMLLADLSAETLKERAMFGRLARERLVVFAQLNTPDPADAFNARLSRFTWERHHHYIAAALEKVARGEINRLEIELPPRHGKSELAVRQFVVWFVSRFPGKSIIVVTHTDTLAREHGRDCRDYWNGPGFAVTFGHDRNARLRSDTQAADRLQTVAGGGAIFSGRGGLGAGVGADVMIFDDFFKNSAEAESQTVREEAWRTYISDCQSRLNNSAAPVIMIGSRRHEDDVQGRLFDSTNQHYDAKEAARWTRIRLPALAEDNDALGRKKDEALWPAKFDFEFYQAKRTHVSDIVRMDFQTQDQCNPTPAEGNYFKRKWLKTYDAHELPKHLRIYASSDHAYRKGQKNDLQCLLVVGIDPSDVIWVLPDTWWQRAETDQMVEAMIGLMQTRKPSVWWAARDAISGSVGPFLNKRMRERKVFAWIDDDIREDKDLERRAQSIRNRMAMGMVRFPSFWPQYADAEKELTTFPNGKHDDLVAALALLGMGLDKMFKADAPFTAKPDLPNPRTLEGIRTFAKRIEAEERSESERKGW